MRGSVSFVFIRVKHNWEARPWFSVSIYDLWNPCPSWIGRSLSAILETTLRCVFQVGISGFLFCFSMRLLYYSSQLLT